MFNLGVITYELGHNTANKVETCSQLYLIYLNRDYNFYNVAISVWLGSTFTRQRF